MHLSYLQALGILCPFLHSQYLPISFCFYVWILSTDTKGRMGAERELTEVLLLLLPSSYGKLPHAGFCL